MTVKGAGFIRDIRVDTRRIHTGYPFNLPVVAWLARSPGLDLAPAVTFLVGENGSGKSTLIEAVAVACGFNAEGGSQSFQFATRASESALADHLVVGWGLKKPRTGFFLRAESYYNVATEIERLDEIGPAPLLPAYGGVSPHERSHGESFLDLITHRFGPQGLYILDEPEAALSVRGCMAVLARIADLVRQGSQFVIATHSPILLALPGATILQLDGDGVASVAYDDALPVTLTREFLTSPERYLRHLLAEDV
ncbi:AAA family ATPase [Planotetraspora kaengkrachanensis]|uniref:ATPase AAA n=1 Tax=Planotetraspora kaengkrachanensis TaxID=575193 RepID=A0A8J3LV63_9ACTN|nr:ATPase AAA [Planotetraspora kaengkrachanensis]